MPVTGIRRRERARRAASRPTEGFVACDKLVICAGQWSRAARRAWPASTSRSSACSTSTSITEPIAGVTPGLPTLRDPDRLTYYKEEVGGLVMGGYEPNPKPWAESGIPDGFHFPLLDTDWDHFEPIMELAARPRAGARDRRHQAVHQRPGELHARRQLHPRRGAGGARASSSAPASTPSASPRAAAPAWRSPNGSPKASRPTTSGRSTSAASAATTSRRLGPHPHARGLRQALHDGLAVRGVRLRPAAPPLAALRSPEGAAAPASARSSAGSGRTGSPTPGEAPEDIYTLRPAELVRRRRPRAPRLPRARRPLRPDLLRQVHDGRPRRRGGALLDLRQRRRQAARHASSTPRC